jgi:hypothetical protein
MESHDNRAGVLFARHARRIFGSTDRDGSQSESGNNRNGGDYWSGLGPTARASGRVTPLRPADVGYDRVKHGMISFTGGGPLAALSDLGFSLGFTGLPRRRLIRTFAGVEFRNPGASF